MGWALVIAGWVVSYGWLGVVIGVDRELAPLVEGGPYAAGAALTGVGGVVGARRRAERQGPLRLAALSGALALLGVLAAAAGAPDPPAAVLLVLGFQSALAAAIWAALGRDRGFKKHPERVREPLSRRIRRGWTEATKSWVVLWRHRTLLALPAIAVALAVLEWGAAFLLTGAVAERAFSRLAITAFVVLLPSALTGTFFGVAYLAALDRRLDGKPGSIGDGLRIAWSRRGPIAGWALLAAGVGAVLQALQQLRSEWAVLPLLTWVAGVAWGILTIFVIPVLAVEELGTRDSLRRAAALVRQRWGEGLGGLGNIATTWLFVIVPLTFALSMAAALLALPDVAILALLIVPAVVTLLAYAALVQVLTLVLYRHAAGRAAVAPFIPDDLEHALVPRRRLRRI